MHPFGNHGCEQQCHACKIAQDKPQAGKVVGEYEKLHCQSEGQGEGGAVLPPGEQHKEKTEQQSSYQRGFRTHKQHEKEGEQKAGDTPNQGIAQGRYHMGNHSGNCTEMHSAEGENVAAPAL